MVVFNDLSHDWDQTKDGYKITDLKKRTDVLRDELGIVSELTTVNSSIITSLDKKLNIIDDKIEDVEYIVGALLLKETSMITEEELKTIYRMITSPDKENKVVAEEAISNKLKELE